MSISVPAIILLKRVINELPICRPESVKGGITFYFSMMVRQVFQKNDVFISGRIPN
jgi:hypothetical protein